MDRGQRDSARRRRIRERGRAAAQPVARQDEHRAVEAPRGERGAAVAVLVARRLPGDQAAGGQAVRPRLRGSVRVRERRRSDARQAGQPPHPPAARDLRARLRRDARARRVAPGRSRGDARPHGRAAASRDGRDSRRSRDDLRHERRPARDRRADEDDLRRPAPARGPAGGRGCRAPHPRRRREPALSAAPQPQDGLRLRPALRRPGEGGGVHAEEVHRRQRLPGGEARLSAGQRRLAGVGFAGTDNKGLGGLEIEYDRQLTGKPGKQTIVRDPFGQAIDVVSATPGAAGP